MVQNTKEILIWVGLVAAVSAGAAGLLGSGIISSAQTESLVITESSLKVTGNSAILTVAVKNAGTSQIGETTVNINALNIGTINNNATSDFTSDVNGNNLNLGTIDTTSTIYFEGRENINAGQTVYWSGTLPTPGSGASLPSIGESFTITVVGDLTGTDDIVTTGVVTATGF